MIELIHLKCNPELKVYFKAILCLTVVVFNLGCSSNPTIDIPQEALDADGYQLTKIVKTENDRGLVTEEHWYTTTYNKSGRITNESEKLIQQSFNEMDSLIERKVTAPDQGGKLIEHDKRTYPAPMKSVHFSLSEKGDTLIKESRTYRAHKVLGSVESIFYEDNVVVSYGLTTYYYGEKERLDSIVFTSTDPNVAREFKTLKEWRQGMDQKQTSHIAYNEDGMMSKLYELGKNGEKYPFQEWTYEAGLMTEKKTNFFYNVVQELFDENGKLIKKMRGKNITLFYYKEDADWQVHYKSD